MATANWSIFEGNNNNNSPFFYSALSLQQFPCASAIIIAVIRKSSELLRFIYRRQPANAHNLSDIKLWHPPITATHISLGSTRQARLSILPKDTNTLALTGLELTTFLLKESCSVPLDHTRSLTWRYSAASACTIASKVLQPAVATIVLRYMRPSWGVEGGWTHCVFIFFFRIVGIRCGLPWVIFVSNHLIE